MVNENMSLKIYRRDDYICQYCGLDGHYFENWRYLCVDHIKPDGGYVEENLTTACLHCNLIKGPKSFSSLSAAKEYIQKELNTCFKQDFKKQMDELKR